MQRNCSSIKADGVFCTVPLNTEVSELLTYSLCDGVMVGRLGGDSWLRGWQDERVVGNQGGRKAGWCCRRVNGWQKGRAVV